MGAELRVEVQLHPLKYSYELDANGRKVRDHDGTLLLKDKPREKGVDVLCALALVREARNPDIGLVILASHDSDLDPALDEAAALGTAKIETFLLGRPRATPPPPLVHAAGQHGV